MEWHNQFQSVFFLNWRKAGLPAPEDYLSSYYLMLEQRDQPIEWIEYSTGIDHSRLYDVYGFGVTVGKLLGVMLGLTAEQIKQSADWCGRFNLGISLFDYISDELDAVQSVSSLTVFKAFQQGESALANPSSSAEELMSNLAASVLLDVSNLALNHGDALMHAMKDMFAAEAFIATTNLTAYPNLKKIEEALYSKSAAPFKAMAEYCACIKMPNDDLLHAKAAKIGNALGQCYWMIDDAKDVWDDLKDGQWNLFFKLAAEKNPQILSEPGNRNTAIRLLHCWEEEDHAEKVSIETIARLQNAIAILGLEEDEKNHALGIIAASLWQWYHS